MSEHFDCKFEEEKNRLLEMYIKDRDIMLEFTQKAFKDLKFEIEKAQKVNSGQEKILDGMTQQFEKMDGDVKKEISTIKKAIDDFKNNMNNGWKNDLVAMVIKATLGINQTKTKGFWDWIKGAFTVAFFLGIFELIKFIMR